MNGRNDVLELHGLEALGQHLTRLEPVARLGPDLLGVPRPWRERLFHGQLPLDCAAEWRLADALRLCARGDERQTGEEPAATLAHAAHLAPRSRSAGSLGGLPRSQKTSRSIVRLLPRPSSGVSAHVMWNRPTSSVMAARPLVVTSRTPGRPFSPASWWPLPFASSKTLPITSVQSKVRSGTTRTVAVASFDTGAPPTAARAWARFTNSPSPTPAPTASISTMV